MPLPAKTCECPCGEIVPIHTEILPWNDGNESYAVCDIECPKCHRRSGGGNYKDGTISGWSTRAELDASQAEYERQCFDADMNEWYGRGEW